MTTATDLPDPAPAQTPCAPATQDEIRRAEALRRAIEERYLGAREPASNPYWCVGAD